MRVLISGSRSISDPAALESAIAASQLQITEVVTGDSVGVDDLASRWAADHHLPIMVVSMDWHQLGGRAERQRNEQAVQLAEACLVVWDGFSRGTADLITLAHQRGRQVIVYQCNPQQASRDGTTHFHRAGARPQTSVLDHVVLIHPDPAYGRLVRTAFIERCISILITQAGSIAQASFLSGPLSPHPPPRLIALCLLDEDVATAMVNEVTNDPVLGRLPRLLVGVGPGSALAEHGHAQGVSICLARPHAVEDIPSLLAAINRLLEDIDGETRQRAHRPA